MAESALATTAPVLVTGATGYIATHLVEQLLEKGYRVRGTVRSTDPAKVAHLTALPHAATNLELVVADLLGDNAFDEAVRGCEIVMHTASPYVMNVTDPQRDLVDPAVKGTVNVLGSCQKMGGVRRVILTSSMAAITDEPDTQHVYTEADWNEHSSLSRNPYYFSKTLAEKAAWKFVEDMTENKFQLVVINPYMVIGPCHTASINTSINVFIDMATGKFPGIIDLHWGIVDVRDVAKAHVLAMEKEGANGRNVCTAYTVSMRTVVDQLKASGYNYKKLPSTNLTCGPGNALVNVFSHFQPKDTGTYLRTHLGRVANCDSSKMKRELDMDFLPFEQTLKDTFDDLVRWNHVPAPPPPKAPKADKAAAKV